MDVESNTYQDKVYGDPHKNGNLQLKYQDKVLRDRRIELTLEECEVVSCMGIKQGFEQLSGHYCKNNLLRRANKDGPQKPFLKIVK